MFCLKANFSYLTLGFTLKKFILRLDGFPSFLSRRLKYFFFEANENLNIKGLMVSDFLAAVLKMSIKKNPVDFAFLVLC